MHKSIFLLFFCASLVALHFYIGNVSFPNTYINDIPVGMMSKQKILQLLEQEKTKSVEIIVRDRHYSLPLRRFNITVNTTENLRRIFTENTKPFPKNYIAFFTSFSSKRTYFPAIEFGTEFHQIMQQMVFDFTTKQDEIYFDDQTKSLHFTNNQDKYRIDIPLFQISIIKSFGKDKLSIKPTLVKIQRNQSSENHVASLNQKISALYKDPVKLAVTDATEKHEISLTTDELREVLGARYDPTKKNVDITVQETNLQNVIKAKHIPIKNPDKSINFSQIIDSLKKIFNDRFEGIPSNTIYASTNLKPNTDGTVADKYIEVDISQQRMYLWEGGKVIADYIVSTGLYYPTPTGKFKILNKAKNAFSDIYNVWMPYWMAIYYDPKVQAYIGIHELPYWYSGGGIQRRPREFLGTPRTGGCISLDVGVAQKVQDWADIGMPVHVYN